MDSRLTRNYPAYTVYVDKRVHVSIQREIYTYIYIRMRVGCKREGGPVLCDLGNTAREIPVDPHSTIQRYMYKSIGGVAI